MDAIMRPTEFSADMIVALLRKQTVASLSEVMAALGTGARRTAFRKAQGPGDFATSYSHRGGYYTLDERVEFDERGLWSFDGVRFSSVGTLIATAESFVNQAQVGHFSEELRQPAACRRSRTPCASSSATGLAESTQARGPVPVLRVSTARARRGNCASRRLLLATPGLGRPLPDADLMPANCAPLSCCSPVCSTNGSGVCSPGWSHSSAAGAATGASPACWASTRPRSRIRTRQLVERDVDLRPRAARGRRCARQRKKNAGSHRPPRSLMAHETPADPSAGLKWTRRTTAKIAPNCARSASTSARAPSPVSSRRWGFLCCVNQQEASPAPRIRIATTNSSGSRRYASAAFVENTPMIMRRYQEEGTRWRVQRMPAPSGTASPNW